MILCLLKEAVFYGCRVDSLNLLVSADDRRAIRISLFGHSGNLIMPFSGSLLRIHKKHWFCTCLIWERNFIDQQSKRSSWKKARTKEVI